MAINSEADSYRKSVTHVLETLGESWSMLIVREAFFGTRRFEGFQQNLGIARNILADRLKKLCHNGILERVPIREGARRQEYCLTNKGKDLLPTLIALTQWGDRWVFGEGEEPFLFVERENDERIQPIQVSAADGRALRPREIRIKAGPGASDLDMQRVRDMDNAENS